MSAILETIHVAPALRAYLLDLADATRRHPALALGLSPRGLLALQRVARAQAASQGRGFVTPDDVKALARVVLPHRLLATPESRMRGVRPTDVITEIIDGVPVPRPEPG
jgi:MoxR-like ATPase